MKTIKKANALSQVVFREVVTSTQEVARGLGADPPYLVWTERQTQGRGRRGRVWHSDPGGLYFTLVIETPSQSWAVPLVAAYALYKSLEPLVPGLYLKWPNDLYVGARKLSGMLTESWGKRLGIGVGLNVNQTGFESSVSDTATSLRMLREMEYRLEDLLERLVSDLIQGIEGLNRHGFGRFHPHIRGLLTNQSVRVRHQGGIGAGRLLDIGPEGEAVVEISPDRRIKVPLEHLLEAG